MFQAFLIVFLIGGVLSSPSGAYLDPGTGSYIFQITAAFIFGGLLLVKQFWTGIKDKFRSGSNKEEESEDNAN